MAGGEQAAPPPKQEELQPRPSKDQLPNISYCITSPPPWREFLNQKKKKLPILLLCRVLLVLCPVYISYSLIFEIPCSVYTLLMLYS